MKFLPIYKSLDSLLFALIVIEEKKSVPELFFFIFAFL